MGRSSRRVAFLAAFALSAIAGCASPTDDGEGDVEQGSTQAISTADGFVYFHGMSHLGFAPSALRTGLGTQQSLLAPAMSDAQIQDAVSENVIDFLGARHEAVVAGYSLGRIPVLRLMAANAAGMTRAVLVDPTYDGSHALGFGVGGGIARAWLDADPARSLLLVYGDVTRSLGGETSYVSELSNHERASLCYVRGDHERFRQGDMVAALVAKDCADLTSRLSAR
jgi:hypothetical protein